MRPVLEKYLRMSANVRTDRGRGRYHEITYHRAPHKPFLLLSVMDLIAQGWISRNLIEPSSKGARVRSNFLTAEAVKQLMTVFHSPMSP